MGSLPKHRLQNVYPFHTVGVDIGGPFYTKEGTRRNAKISKSYMCLFVCYSTRAVHLEALTALTCECFLAAFDRFTGRRGLVHTVFSDNGGNFVAASRYFNEVTQFFRSSNDNIMQGLTYRNIHWKHNPPTASHFGGMFEAGIKSAKTLLRRVTGSQPMTFEEFSTLLTRVEGILNSRPLCPLSNDPDEFEVLTPGHFLVGRQLVSAPEYDLTHEPVHHLTRWQLIKHMTQQFWRRWKQDYLHTLQQRQKWFTDTPNIAVGDVVLIHCDNVTSQHWNLGRVEQVFPGTDGRVRVVSLRTRNTILRRPVNKISPLPKPDNC